MAPIAVRSFRTNDGLELKFLDTGFGEQGEGKEKEVLILIHGFTGTHRVWERNLAHLTPHYRIIAPDLRGHGGSETPAEPYTSGNCSVVRLADDLKELISFLCGGEEGKTEDFRCKAIGGSLGCAILWSYAHKYTTKPFTQLIFIDQSPLQSQLPDWQPPYSHKGLRTPLDLQNFQTQITTDPQTAHAGTINSCLGYVSHPISDPQTQQPLGNEKEHSAHNYNNDYNFFMTEALKGKEGFYAALMADHTVLDHRANIKKDFGREGGSKTKVLMVASSRSGCFEPEGPTEVVRLINADGGEGEERRRVGDAKGDDTLARAVVVGWGGHWCYWEDPEKFAEVALGFLNEQ